MSGHARQTEPPAQHLTARPHSKAEDGHALAMGAAFVAFGIVLLKAAGLVTGGVAGIALIISYATSWPVGPLFVLLNLPFFVLAQRQMGVAFTIKSALTMVTLALLAGLMPGWLGMTKANPLFAAVFGGSLIGMGVLSLARHRASVGGIGIVALYLQEQRGLSAGLVQMTSDIAILAGAFPVIGTERLLNSSVSAIALRVVIFAYHRPGRYIGY